MPFAGLQRFFGTLAVLLLVSVSCSSREAGAPPGQNRDAAPVGDSPLDASQGILADSDEADRGDPLTDSQSDSTLLDADEAGSLADGSELALCLRLMDPQNKTHELELSKAVDDQYIMLIDRDCRVHKANYPPGEAEAIAFATWRNVLYAYNLDLWGCTGKTTTGFALLSTAFQDVSAADAAQLIELYLSAATNVLALTAREIADLRRDLQRLASPRVTNGSTDYTLSACAPDAGPDAGDAAEEAKDAPEEKAVDASEEMALDASREALDTSEEIMDASEETMNASQGDAEGGN
jgi:hypothetical protein